jgi:MFS family permease
MNETESPKYIAYRYRWVVLLMYILITMVTQIMWLTFAPINEISAAYLGTSPEIMQQLTATFMYAYIPANFLASYLIDKWGLRWGVGVGVIMTSIFGFLRAFNNQSFIWVLMMQIGMAIGQPFILNASVKVAATWFKEDEKAMAAGLGTMAMLLGSIVGMVLGPIIVDPFLVGGAMTKQGMNWLLFSYGIVGLVIGALYLIFVKQKPATPPNAYAEKTKVLMWKGVKKLFQSKDFLLLFAAIFISLGAINALSTKIDTIFPQDSVNADIATPGLIGGVTILGGIFGAVILGALSDKTGKRKPFMILAMISAIPLLILMYYMENLIVVFLVAGVLGFLLISSLPIGLTYGADITYPVPEETSTGVLMLIGQISGILFVFLPDKFFMLIMAGIFVIAAIFIILMKDISHYKLES